MQTIGFVGVGKIGLPICKHLIDSGYRVLGYRRSSLEAFEKMGGVPAASPSAIGNETDMVFTCLSSDQALEEVINGPEGLIHGARPGQIIVEFGSHPVAFKQKFVAPLADKGAIFVDGEVSGTPGMVEQRKGVIYLGGDADAAKRVEEVVGSFAELCIYLGPFGTATTVKLLNNWLVGLNIAGTAQAMAIGLRSGVDVDLMIKAIAGGSGASTQFAIRAPWMAERKFLPQQGPAPGLLRYLELARDLGADLEVATPLLDSTIALYQRALPVIGERDVAAIIEIFENQGGRP